MAYGIKSTKKKEESAYKVDSMFNFKRIKSQEFGNVYRWYENDEGDIFSVVKGYSPFEANIRVSSAKGKFDSFEIRGHKDIILKKSDEELMEIVNRGMWKHK
jgi:hypothetical protein